MDNSFLLYSTYKDVCHCGLNIFANLQKDLQVFRFIRCGMCFYRAHFMVFMLEVLASITSVWDVFLVL